jgi:lysophospholipase L1-like esterase
MKKKIVLLLVLVFVLGCDSEELRIEPGIPNSNQNTADDESNGGTDDDTDTTSDNDPTGNETNTDLYNILSLGDSYTIGESVCSTCRFPEQLKDSLAQRFEDSSWEVDVIAQTGWTTTNLANAINGANLATDYDLVTLLIGVNNQYQSLLFSTYISEFPELVETSIEAAQGDKNRVIVISIPDYAFTPFGQGQGNAATISSEIDNYNNFAESYCNQENISYVYITDITRQGLENTDLVASDGLHPSTLAYTKFVERLLPIAIEKLQLEED